MIVEDRAPWPGHGAQRRAFRRQHRCSFRAREAREHVLSDSWKLRRKPCRAGSLLAALQSRGSRAIMRLNHLPTRIRCLIVAHLLILGLVLSMPLHAQLGPRTDFGKEYPRPTITAVGPFDLVLGRPPKVHIHIQYRATQYVCSSYSEAEVKAKGLKVGTNVDIREQGKYLKVRMPGQRTWVKLRLVSKDELHNL